MSLRISLRSTGDPGEHVGLAQNQQVLTVDGDLGAAVLAVEHFVALGDVKRDALARVVTEPAVADRQHLALLRLLLRRIGKNDPGSGRRLLLHGLDDHTIAEWLELHRTPPPMGTREGSFGTRDRRVPSCYHYTATRCGRRDRRRLRSTVIAGPVSWPTGGRRSRLRVRGGEQCALTAVVIGRIAARSRSRVGVMPDTTLLHLITGHTVRTTSSVDAALAAL